jgi:ATP-dependent HslUV protease, peptidase subunit HslV
MLMKRRRTNTDEEKDFSHHRTKKKTYTCKKVDRYECDWILINTKEGHTMSYLMIVPKRIFGGAARSSIVDTTTTRITKQSRTLRLQVGSNSTLSLRIINAQQQSNQPYQRLYHTTIRPEQQSVDRHGTTIVCVRKNGSVCMMGDGMVSQGSMIVKPNALKLRRIVSKNAGSSSSSSSSSSTGSNNPDDVDPEKDKNVTIVGFAGSTADAFTLLERLEGKLDEYPGQLARSCVELAKGWRTDKYLRRLEASLIVADATCSLELTGNGDVLESHDGVLGVGSGSPYAIGTFTRVMFSFR